MKARASLHPPASGRGAATSPGADAKPRTELAPFLAWPTPSSYSDSYIHTGSLGLLVHSPDPWGTNTVLGPEDTRTQATSICRGHFLGRKQGEWLR